MKKFVPFIVCVALLTTVAVADAIHTWTSGQAVRATDLNGNFTHVHTLMVGGGAQGAPHNLLVDADVSPSANISTTKLAGGGNLARAWAYVGGPCDGAATIGTPCTFIASSQVTSVTSTGFAGEWNVTLAYAPTDANFAVMVTQENSPLLICRSFTHQVAAPNFIVDCRNLSNTLTNGIFTFQVLDDN